MTRDAELADRRLQAIATERSQWHARKLSAASQIETVETRLAELQAEREQLEDAPAQFGLQRRALISEVEQAEQNRQIAADALATAETAMAETDRLARGSIESLSAAREACGRAEERTEGGKRRLEDIEREIRDMLEVEPDGRCGHGRTEGRRRAAAGGRCRG